MADSNSKQNMTTIIQIVILVLLCVGVAAMLYFFGAFNTTKASHVVALKIESSAGMVQVIYSLPDESSKDPLKTSAPWSKTVTLKSGSEVYLEAASPVSSGQLRCIILVDGKSWKTQVVSAPETKVTCAGIIP
jgi:hypothetical protein